MTTIQREELGPIVSAYCCREWPVYLLYPVKRCGRCGTQPEVPADVAREAMKEYQRTLLINRVSLAMPDEYPQGFARHVVNEFLAQGTTGDPQLDKFLRA